MQEQVRGLLAEVKRSGERTGEHVGNVVGAAQSAGDGVRRQYEDLDQVATAMNEMSATVAGGASRCPCSRVGTQCR